MRRLKKIEARLAVLEKEMAAVKRLKIVNDAPENQLLSATASGAAVPVKSGPTSGEINLSAGTINMR